MAKKEKAEVAVIKTQDVSIESVIQTALDKGVPVETMERLMAMRRELKAEAAKTAYDTAMAAFQAECPIIEKTKAGGKTRGGSVAYYYAPLESIVSQVKDLLRKHGFSYGFDTTTATADEGGMVTAICIAKHELGHSEKTSFEVPLGTKTDIMSSTQVTAAAITYAKRYAFCNAFGILTGDEDTDAAPIKGSTEPYNVPTQDPKKKQIKQLLTRLGYNNLDTKEEYEEAVLKLTNLVLTEVNYDQIISLLAEKVHDDPMANFPTTEDRDKG